MDNKLDSGFRFFWCGLAVLCLQATMLRAFAQIDCASTPLAAVQLSRGETLHSPVAEGKGYRVTSIRRDHVLDQRWATIARCGHPEWPSLSLRTSETDTALHLPVTQIQEEDSQARPSVRAGDIVHLWRQESLLRIEVTGVAEENGRVGKLIRVRLLRSDTDDQSIEQQFTGIVRGPADVEMQR